MQTSALETRRSFDVENIDQCVYVSRCVSLNTAIHRIHIRQKVAQFWVGDIVGNELIDRPKKLFAVRNNVFRGGTKMKYVDLISEFVERFDIIVQLFALLREVDCKTFGKCLSASRNAISDVILAVSNLIHTPLVHIAQPKTVDDTEIRADSVQGSTLSESSEYVHSGLELDVSASESLQTTADNGVFL